MCVCVCGWVCGGGGGGVSVSVGVGVVVGVGVWRGSALGLQFRPMHILYKGIFFLVYSEEISMNRAELSKEFH